MKNEAVGNVSIRSLRKVYGSTVAVDDVELHIPAGTFFCLVGPSGCGKTTLLRMLAGLVDPDGGDIEIDGKPMGHLPANRRPTSIVFQDYALFPHMTVYQNAEFGLNASKRVSRNKRNEAVMAALGLLELGGLSDRYPRELSGGQQQRVALARSLVIEPDVLLMDEPLSNLDAKMRVSLRSSLKELQKRLDITTIYVTHDQEEALAMADSVAVMNSGAIQQIGTPMEVYDAPVNEFVADFIGVTNVFTARSHSGTDGMVELEFATGERLETPLRNQVFEPVDGQEVRVSIRPDAMTPVTSRTTTQRLHAEVVNAQITGGAVRYELAGYGQRLVYFHNDPYAPLLEGTVQFRVDPERIRILEYDGDQHNRSEGAVAAVDGAPGFKAEGDEVERTGV